MVNRRKLFGLLAGASALPFVPKGSAARAGVNRVIGMDLACGPDEAWVSEFSNQAGELRYVCSYRLLPSAFDPNVRFAA